MSKLEDALDILRQLGLPRAQQNDRSALVLLALADMRPKGKWSGAKQPLLRIWDIMGFIREVNKKDYAANTRETIRRQSIHQFEQARLVNRNPDDPKRPTNSGKTVYTLTDEAAAVLRTYGTSAFASAVGQFLREFGSLNEVYQRRRESNRVALKLPSGASVYLSPGEHNRLQVAVVEQMGPRYAAGAEVLYVGDTAKKYVVCESERLAELGVPLTEHDKLPDIILYDVDHHWLLLIEAVTSHGPMSPKRQRELARMLAGCSAGKVYMTAFLTQSEFRKHIFDIAWETEVWIAESPEHMIHFNGPKYLGPYE